MTQTEKPLGVQISHMLKDRGVDVIFGIPGVHNQEMYRGIEEAGMTHILARHEQGAGFMADGYARATGRPGVCYVITGPGLCNAMTALGQAYSDSVPVLCISSCLDETSARRGQLHQMLDQEGAGATVCDWSHTARTAGATYALIDRALVEFDAARPRSKHITVPIAALQGMAPAFDGANENHDRMYGPVSPAVGDLAHQIKSAQRPLFIFGGGCVDPLAYRPVEAAIRNLMKRSGAAAFMTYAGRGLVASDDPMSFGSFLARPSSADVFAQADLVVTFGSELAEGDLWRHDLGHDCPHYRIDIDPEVLAQHPYRGGTVQGRVEDVLLQLLPQLPEQVPSKWDANDIAQWRAKWRAEVESERPGIIAVTEIIKDALPDGTMIYSDMTQIAYTAKEVWDMEWSGCWHHPTGFGTLGYAVPAAIGGAVARPGRPTMAIIGDYGFQYTVQELGTAVELGQPLPIILWDNGKLGEIEASMVSAQIAPNAVIAHNPDFLALARAYGAAAVAPLGADAIKQAIQDAFDAKGPTVIRLTPDSLSG